MFEELPHFYEGECSVLGSILLEPQLFKICDLKPDEFYDPRHKLIMQYMIHLDDITNEKPIDIVTIVDYAGKDDKEKAKNLEKIGSINYLFELQNSVPTTANFKWYHDMVREKAQLRKAMIIMRDRSNVGAGMDDSNEFIAESIKALENLKNAGKKEQGFVRMGDVLVNHETEIESRKEKEGLTGTKTAGRDLNKLTGGWQKQDLIIIAARPSIGKTAFIVDDINKGQNHAFSNHIEGSAAALFSIEMRKKLIVERALCNLGNIDSKHMKTGNMDGDEWQRWSIATSRLKQLPIFIDDTPGITIQQIDRQVGELAKKFPNLIVYIDYLQKIKPGVKFQKKHEGVAYVSEGLKLIARKYDIPIVAISAVGRDCEKRQDKRPLMADLRESGSIESDADIIIFLYRDDYYNPESSKAGIMELIVAKGRDTGTGVVEMAYLPKYSKFVDLDYSHHEKAGAASGKSGSSHE